MAARPATSASSRTLREQTSSPPRPRRWMGSRSTSARAGASEGTVPTAAVLAAGIAWALFVGSLAVARHDNLRTNAFDLGYVTQTLWNTAHGDPYRLTVLEGASFQPEGLDPARIRQPH